MRSAHHTPGFGSTPSRSSSIASHSALLRGRPAKASTSGSTASASAADSPVRRNRSSFSRDARKMLSIARWNVGYSSATTACSVMRISVAFTTA